MCIRDSPIACSAIANDFYVDDLMTGSDNPHVLSKMKSDITDLLSQYGFILHKWFSNDQTIIASHAHSSLDFSKNQTVRTLGIQWDIEDVYKRQQLYNHASINLSDVMRLYVYCYFE